MTCWKVLTSGLILVGIIGCGSSGSGPADPNAASQVVGAGGGTVTTGNGIAQLVIPAGAVAGNTTFTIAHAGSPPANPSLIAGRAFQFGPSGVNFTSPVTAKIKFDPLNLPTGFAATELALFKVVAGDWELVPGSTADTVNNLVSGNVSTFSVYGVLGASKYAATEAPGSYSGGPSGFMFVTIKANGKVLITHRPGGDPTLAGAGTISPTGALDVMVTATGIGANPAFPLHFTGTVTKTGDRVQGSGGFTSDSFYGGTWAFDSQP